ncbi:MAG: restriction endonuclease [Ignavibacteriae bacterium HGW-Ignavibacteriae-3]|nr:MAG: restriction endonuclease [Ignavibacteriae bacterium HGW-Ignavibacteriae-3]
MTADKLKLIGNYLHIVKSANKETPKKEALKDLLNRLYYGDQEIQSIIDQITLGAEKSILEIPRKDKLHKGSADTLYNKIIIEFENDLKVTLKHAKEQLAGYLLGQFNSGEGYNFTLIASDCITWKVYAPDVSCLDKLDSLTEDKLILNEVKSATFTLTERNGEEFYFWLDRFLFKEEKLKATLSRIEEAFGYQSNVFIESFRQLTNHFNSVKKFGEVQVSYEQWSKFLSIAYGSFDASESNFLIHTYLSIFAKMLAYAVVSNDDYIDDRELKGIIDGTIFHKYNIRNFVDDDFFHWIKNERNFSSLKKVFRLIAQEISTFDFRSTDEDILKGVYQELIDLDTRHALGEYYTPDWLCERIVREFDFKEGNRVLDPACGSGSFLIASVHRFRELNPEIPIEELNASIYGIDIHPLSVQISKTNMLLALGKGVVNARTPIHLNVILANTLLAPDGVEDLFGKKFKMQIDKETLELSSQILDDVKIFDEALEASEELAEQTFLKKKATFETFTNILRKQIKGGGLNKQVIENFYKIYESFRNVKEKGRDSIWKFIVQNLYKPYFLSKKFDYVIGNPPWFTYSSIKNEDYQDILNELAEKYDVKPERVANFPHLEIAAIFLAYCTSYFLKENGELAFVLPRSFFSADHHDNTRSGKAKGFRIKKIWDLNDVAPLFRVPSSVLFAGKEKESVKRNIPAGGIDGTSFRGAIPAHNCKLLVAGEKLEEENQKWYYIKQGSSTAFSTRKVKSQSKVNPYKENFRQGATIVPRAFYFVELTQEMPDDFNDRIINIKTADAIKADSKVPWKGLDFSGRIESKFLFRTALSKSILPFALFEPALIVLPITIKQNDLNKKEIHLHSANELMSEGYLNASRWFKNNENTWDLLKTEKSKEMSTNKRIDFQRGLSEQNLDAPYLVLYNSSAKDANATIVFRKKIDLEFLVESVTYVFYTNKIEEAFYLVSYFNSNIPNQRMKDFQAKGLFGERHVHKRILDIYFPKYDEADETHLRLAELGKAAHVKADKYLKDNPPQKELTAIHLGRLRVEIKKHLSSEMKEIDKIVKKLIG